MSDYKCIFFDLDHTLWDYETNSRITLEELYEQHNLHAKGVTSFNDFLIQFKEVNAKLWYLYDRGLIDSEVIRAERFKQILEPFHIHDATLIGTLSKEYLHSCPKKNTLMPFAIEVLEYLVSKYSLTVVTNGFEEIQNLKLASGDLHKYFKHIITSQKAGHKKPAREIFEFALSQNAARHHEAVMIGDNLVTDIGGARNASIDAIFFNPEENSHNENVHREITSLDQLKHML